ncbi:NAD(P)/FAD-dependent oxidoreductase [Chloroflexota bacterium]
MEPAFLTEAEGGTGKDMFDVIIIGGGPAGATAAIYTARADLKTLVLDKSLTAGALGMTGKIANYPGVPGEISGAELLQRIRVQADGFGAEFVQDKVVATNLRGDVKEVTGGRESHRARAVVIATGSMGRTRTVRGEEQLIGRGVSYCATCDGAFFRDREVAVVGSNDEAVEEALFLTRFASRVHLLVSTADLKSSSDLADEASQHPKVEIHTATRLREVVGQQLVQSVRVVTRDGQEQEMPVAGVFIYLQGGKPITDFLGDQLPLTESGCLTVDESMQTGLPGVFAVGDLLCNHHKQAVVAAGEGVVAAMALQRYLSGRGKLRADWS